MKIKQDGNGGWCDYKWYLTIVCGGAILVLSFAGAICHKVQYEFEHRFLEGTDGDPDMADNKDKL